MFRLVPGLFEGSYERITGCVVLLVELRQSLLLMNISFHRLNARLVVLDAWVYRAPIEKNQWIMARVEMDGMSGRIEGRKTC